MTELTTHHVLVVDDDVRTRHLVRELVAAEGIQASCAASGEEALEILKAKPCTLMITDLRMPPGMDGLALTIRAKEICPDLAVVITTGEISTAVRQIAASIGVDRVVGKPCGADQIREIIRNFRASGKVEPFPVPPEWAGLRLELCASVAPESPEA